MEYIEGEPWGWIAMYVPVQAPQIGKGRVCQSDYASMPLLGEV